MKILSKGFARGIRMSKEKQLVSVVMATFNEPVEMIEGAIGSILNQTYQNIELLIF